MIISKKTTPDNYNITVTQPGTDYVAGLEDNDTLTIDYSTFTNDIRFLYNEQKGKITDDFLSSIVFNKLDHVIFGGGSGNDDLRGNYLFDAGNGTDTLIMDWHGATDNLYGENINDSLSECGGKVSLHSYLDKDIGEIRVGNDLWISDHSTCIMPILFDAAASQTTAHGVNARLSFSEIEQLDLITDVYGGGYIGDAAGTMHTYCYWVERYFKNLY